MNGVPPKGGADVEGNHSKGENHPERGKAMRQGKQKWLVWQDHCQQGRGVLTSQPEKTNPEAVGDFRNCGV